MLQPIRKHMQIDKTQVNQESHIYPFDKKREAFRKCITNTHNMTKYINVMQQHK